MNDITVTTIESLHALIDEVLRLNTTVPTEIWWRGHADETWDLLPQVWRIGRSTCSGLDECLQLERNLTIRFLLGATTRHSHWPEDDHSIQLAMMQHYGLPTRLLDWTESPLFALFFAIREKEYEARNGSLWAIIPSYLNLAEFDTPMLLSPHTEGIKDLFKAPFGVVGTGQNKNAAVVVRHVDPRMSVQHSAFTIHGSQASLSKAPSSHKYLRKYTIPASVKRDLRLQLSWLGIRESSLFPDLEHLASELKSMTEDGRLSGMVPKKNRTKRVTH